MMRTLAAILFFSLAAPLVSIAAEDDPNPVTRETWRVRDLLEHGRYAELDAIELRSRDLRQTVADGNQLRYAYFAAMRCSCAATRDEQFREARMLAGHFAAWSKANPGSLTAQLGPVYNAMDVAFAHRGGGTADSVRAEDWDPYEKNIARAERLLDSMPAAVKAQAQWQYLKLKAVRFGKHTRAEYEAVLGNALEKHPEDFGLYAEALVHYSPLWGGSPLEEKQFIEASALRTQAFWGDAAYARLHWKARSDDMFNTGKADWKRMKAAFEQLVKDYPDPWNVNGFGSFACMAYDFAFLGGMAQTIRAKPVMRAWSTPAWDGKANYERCMKLGDMVFQHGNAR
jgi:hypothetical protein